MRHLHNGGHLRPNGHGGFQFAKRNVQYLDGGRFVVASEWHGTGQLVSLVTIDSASIYIPDTFFGSLLTATARMVEMISMTNNVRRAPRINLDR